VRTFRDVGDGVKSISPGVRTFRDVVGDGVKSISLGITIWNVVGEDGCAYFLGRCW
jgi:hypothetical protein